MDKIHGIVIFLWILFCAGIVLLVIFTVFLFRKRKFLPAFLLIPVILFAVFWCFLTFYFPSPLVIIAYKYIYNPYVALKVAGVYRLDPRASSLPDESYDEVLTVNDSVHYYSDYALIRLNGKYYKSPILSQTIYEKDFEYHPDEGKFPLSELSASDTIDVKQILTVKMNGEFMLSPGLSSKVQGKGTWRAEPDDETGVPELTLWFESYKINGANYGISATYNNGRVYLNNLVFREE